VKGLKMFPSSETTECLLTVHPEQYVLFFKSGTQASSETPARNVNPKYRAIIQIVSRI